MLRTAVNLDLKGRGITSKRQVKVGENFDVIVTIWDDGESQSPVVFDTFISEVWYNDQGIIIEIDLTKPPTAGDLADNSNTTVDVFSLRRVYKIDPRVPSGEPELGTSLKRLDATLEPMGSRRSATDLWIAGGVLQPGYMEATGRAGLSDFRNPFKISPGQGEISAVKGRASVRNDVHGVQPGETNLIAVCNAFLGSRPIPVISEVSTIRVVE